MNKYCYIEAPVDYWATIETITASSYEDAVEKLILKYSEKYIDDNKIFNIDSFEDLQDYLNETYNLQVADLRDIETL